MKPAVSMALLALAAQATAGVKADTPARGGVYSVAVAAGAHFSTPATEHIPRSQLAWEFDRERNGTVAVKGPSGTIWHGNLSVQDGPQTPGGIFPSAPRYRIQIFPGGKGKRRSFEFVPPSTPAQPGPNSAPSKRVL